MNGWDDLFIDREVPNCYSTALAQVGAVEDDTYLTEEEALAILKGGDFRKYKRPEIGDVVVVRNDHADLETSLQHMGIISEGGEFGELCIIHRRYANRMPLDGQDDLEMIEEPLDEYIERVGHSSGALIVEFYRAIK